MLAGVNDVPTVDLLAVSMRLLERNNRFLSNNIANIDTPNFRPSHVDFHESLKLALRDERLTSGTAGVAGGERAKLRIVLEEDGLEARNDGNTVDIESEMARLAANTGKYGLYASLLTKKFEMTKEMLTRLK
jgi:flagellar basal-body rod protein FlgB